jgi:hypothetical protein
MLHASRRQVDAAIPEENPIFSGVLEFFGLPVDRSA